MCSNVDLHRLNIINPLATGNYRGNVYAVICSLLIDCYKLERWISASELLEEMKEMFRHYIRSNIFSSMLNYSITH